MRELFRCGVIAAAVGLGPPAAAGGDWPTFGRDHTHNAVSPELGGPTDWRLPAAAKPGVNDKSPLTKSDAKNVAWSVLTGTLSPGGPVVAGGLVWVGTNNERPRDPADFRTRKNGKKEPIDKSVLMCFREADGAFLWQLAVPRLGGGARIYEDWPQQGMGSTPLVEGDRLWLVTNRSEVLCLDVGPLRRGRGVPGEVWRVDLRKQFGVVPKAALMGFGFVASVAADRSRLYVVTGNGTDENNEKVVAPDAPSLVCLDKTTGKTIWTDNSPGKAVLRYQMSSPLVAEVNGRALCIVGQGDGWLRAFEAATGKLVWKCDLNAKDAKWNSWSATRSTRLPFAATPVLYEDRVYIGLGIDPEQLNGIGYFYCIDAAKDGDVSPELEAAPGRGQPNPNSAVVWRYGGPAKDPGKSGRDDIFGRTLSNGTLHDGLCYACEQTGFLHCLDARTGRCHWTHDTRSEIVAAPLWVDGKVYVGTADGDVWVLAHGREKKVLGQVDMAKPIHTGPVFANGTLYLLTDSTLTAVRPPK